jgi:hypothetical protein
MNDRIRELRNDGYGLIEAKGIARKEEIDTLLSEAEQQNSWYGNKGLAIRNIIKTLRLMNR